jgi:hypothetical protein
MKAHISYSINDAEQFVLTLLSRKLREKGFALTSHFSGIPSSSTIETMAAMKISESNLFIGIITSAGLNQQKVIAEHNLAVSRNVPALLLVEENVQLPLDFLNYNVVFFNRKNPKKAVEHINKNIQTVIKQATYPQSNSTNAFAWLFGGLPLIGLIDQLSTARE